LLEILESLPHHLTAACVSNDVHFVEKVMGNTLNGTTYHGLRARTTGAPQNHWFGPSGDSRGAGIGTPYAITFTWSHHREIVTDNGPVPENWSIPHPI
jgi:1-pyrroline-5-carboxylate dehydrogenase